MNKTHSCLTPEILDQLGQDEIFPDELSDIESHISQCEKCRQLFESVADDAGWGEGLLSILRRPTEAATALSDQHESDADDTALQLLGPTDDPRMLGRIGTYEVTGIVGRGGMGIVFKAYDSALNRFVAIKMLLPHLAASGAARKRFAREGQAAAAVIDDHVLPIFGVDSWQGVPYLVTQYSSGISLQKRIQDQGPLNVREILRIGLQTARGLSAAHAQGLVHRDVKPSNILLDGTVERALLTDFGLARAIDDVSITRSGTITGTPQFMAPEQARAESVDQRSDLFSLGAVMYAMCTGRPPFRAATSLGVMRLISEDEPSPIQEINPDIPHWLCNFIEKLMSKNSYERFESADEVADMLEGCLAYVQQPTEALLPERVEKLAEQWATRQRTADVGSKRQEGNPRGKFLVAACFSILFVFIAGVVAVTLGCLALQSNEHSAEPADKAQATSAQDISGILWSESTNGLQLGIRFEGTTKPTADEILKCPAGESVQLGVYLRNTSDSAIRTGFETSSAKSMLSVSSSSGEAITFRGPPKADSIRWAPLSSNYRSLPSGGVRRLNDELVGVRIRQEYRIKDFTEFSLDDPRIYDVAARVQAYAGSERFLLETPKLRFIVLKAEIPKTTHPVAPATIRYQGICRRAEDSSSIVGAVARLFIRGQKRSSLRLDSFRSKQPEPCAVTGTQTSTSSTGLKFRLIDRTSGHASHDTASDPTLSCTAFPTGGVGHAPHDIQTLAEQRRVK